MKPLHYFKSRSSCKLKPVGKRNTFWSGSDKDDYCLRNVKPCSMTESNQRFGRAYFLHLQGTRANAHTVFISRKWMGHVRPKTLETARLDGVAPQDTATSEFKTLLCSYKQISQHITA